MAKRFPFKKSTLEAITLYDIENRSRGAEYSDAECIGLKLKPWKGGK